MLQVLRRSSFNFIRRGMASNESVVDRCTRKIKTSLNASWLQVTSSNDDPNGNHIAVTCVADIFQGKSPVQRQRLIYKAIWEELERDVHAVDSIQAFTPSEADARRIPKA